MECPLIRVDSFGEPPEFPRPPWLLPVPREPSLPPRPAPPARLFLLTHVHTDHLTGLTGAFVGRIVCTPETKKMLLKLEQQKSRENVHKGVQEVPRKLFEGLRPRPVDPAKPNGRNVDCLVSREYPCNAESKTDNTGIRQAHTVQPRPLRRQRHFRYHHRSRGKPLSRIGHARLYISLHADC